MLKQNRYRLADRVVDPGQCTILNQDNVLKVELRAMQVLLCLINHAGEPVSRDMLLNEVWSGGEVSDNAINRIIGLLRNQLGDNAKKPSFIKTLPKIGYILIAPVTLIQEVTKHEKFITEVIAGSELNTPEHKRHVLKRNVFATLYQHAGKAGLLLTVLLCLLLFSVYQFGHTPIEPKGVIDTQLTRLTYTDNQKLSPVLSPDGKYLSFARRELGAKNWHITLMDLTSREITLLNDPLDSQGYPAFSPDGSQLAYLSFNLAGGCQINRVSLHQGQFGEISKVTDCQSMIQSTGIAWHPSGKSIYYTDQDQQKNYLSERMVFSVDINGANKKQLSQPYSIGTGDYTLSLSPNGRYIAVVRDARWYQVQMMLLSLDTGNWQELFTLDLGLYSVAWSGDSESLIYRAENAQLTRYNIELHTHTQLTNILQPIISPISNQNGDTVAVLGKLFDAEVWRLASPFKVKQVERVEDGEQAFNFSRFIASNGTDARPAISLDGKYVVFISTRTGTPQVWLKPKRGPEVQLTHFTDISFIRDIHFSADGTQILGRNNRQAFIYNIESATIHNIDIQGEHQVFGVSWGPDKHTIIATFDSLGKPSLRLVDINSGKVFEVLVEGVDYGQFSNTGQLYFTKRLKNGLWTLQNGEVKLVQPEFNVMTDMSWMLVGDYAYNLAYRGGSTVIDRVKLDTGEVVSINALKGKKTLSIAVDGEENMYLGVYHESNTNIVKLDE
ncbi:PD40 domain-containing protein [Shewanella sp. VB17]|uniref:winged helix-turn-helix domain-containing protein n=1 Tax=Shewanella sp. VB17 TaxID=2739432 RepID=UPI0015653606|nr:winged helix-turn-helix domain-containing protein [Shewanella sp. VB17]NRD75416.1 PD40 domain-containing protein [Shewanella sp. VB17]